MCRLGMLLGFTLNIIPPAFSGYGDGSLRLRWQQLIRYLLPPLSSSTASLVCPLCLYLPHPCACPSVLSHCPKATLHTQILCSGLESDV
ncbi:hypothetical protein BC827DRAFT_856841 [Russula dissimulans]|nr:hypothetical protein BC827DRAFT_856841 [Russula dissimulans]